MSRVERDFRRNLTRRVRAIVQASPEMRAEWCRRREDRWERALRMICAMVGALIIATLLPFMVSLPALFPHVSRALDNPPLMLIPLPDYALVPMTLGITALLALVSMAALDLLCPTWYLSRAAYYPVSDRQIFRRGLRNVACGLAFGTYCLVPAYVALARFEHVSAWQTLGIAGCVLLQAWHCLAILLIVGPGLPASPGRLGSVIAIGILAFFAAGISAAGYELRHPLINAIALIVLSTPVGWVHGAMAYGVLEGHWWGAIFLLPVGITSVLAVRWLWRGYALHDVRIDSTGRVTPVFAYGLANWPALDNEGRLPTDSRVPADHLAAEISPATAAAQARKTILAGDSLAPLDWTGLGWIERCVGPRLVDDQRAMLEHLSCRRPYWTRAWLLSVIGGSVLLVLLACVNLNELKRDFPELRLTSAVWLLAFFLSEGLAQIESLKVPHYGPQLNPSLPVDMRSALAAVRRMYWLRLPFWMPLFLAVSLVLAAGHSAWPMLVVVNLLIAAVLSYLGLMHHTRCQFFQRVSTHDVGQHLLASLSMAVPFLLGVLLVFYVHWAVSLALLALMVVTSWLIGRWMDWMYFHGRLDFEVSSRNRPLR